MRLFEQARRMLNLTSTLKDFFGEPVRVEDGLRFHGCPKCGRSKGESHKLSASEERWRCHKCGANGTVIDVFAYYWDVSPTAAAIRIARGEAGGCCPVDRPVVVTKAKCSDHPDERQLGLEECFKLLREACKAHADDPVCLRYLTQERKIPLPVIRDAQKRGILAFLPGDPEAATEFLVKLFGRSRMEAVGLWRPGARKSGLAFRPIVAFLPGAKSAEFRLARRPNDERERKALRYGHGDAPWFWSGETPHHALVVEGVIDLLSAVALGFRGDIIGVPGCNNWKLAWFERVRSTRHTKLFTIAMDNDAADPDNPGQTWAHELVSALSLAQLTASNHVLEPNTDLNDLLIRRAA